MVKNLNKRVIHTDEQKENLKILTCVELGSLQLSTTSYFGFVAPSDMFEDAVLQYLVAKSLRKMHQERSRQCQLASQESEQRDTASR